MKVYIHGGMHKTGTTSVQKALLNSAITLEESGVRVFVNRPQMMAKQPDNFDPDWLHNQMTKAEKDGIKTLIFSAEGISTFNSDQLNNFLNPFRDCEIILVACLRHWATYLPSRWSQNCVRRDTQSFPAYIAKLKKFADSHIDARFDLVVSRMIEAKPESIRLISFDNAITDNSLLTSILSAFDLPQQLIVERLAAGDPLNIRKQSDDLELLRLFNGVYSQQHGLPLNERFDTLRDATNITQFYDFSGSVRDFLNANEKLKKELLALLEEKKVEVTLSSEDCEIAHWEELVEDVSRRYLLNPRESRLFNKVEPRTMTYSFLEFNDIPPAIQEKMLAAFKPALLGKIRRLIKRLPILKSDRRA